MLPPNPELAGHAAPAPPAGLPGPHPVPESPAEAPWVDPPGRMPGRLGANRIGPLAPDELSAGCAHSEEEQEPRAEHDIDRFLHPRRSVVTPSRTQ